MKWFTRISSHGDTLDGQLLRSELAQIIKDLHRLLSDIFNGGPHSVLPRWRGEIKRSILLLPKEERIRKMSMIELGELKKKIDNIKEQMNRYSIDRFKEIFGK